MEPPFFNFKELFTHLVGDMAKSIAERPNEAKPQSLTRTQVAAQMIMSFLPRDVIEAMLAGHAVMFHAVLSDSVHDTLRGEIDTLRRATRSNLVALNKAFHMNVSRLEYYKARPSQGVREASGEIRPQKPGAEVEPMVAEGTRPGGPVPMAAEVTRPFGPSAMAAETTRPPGPNPMPAELTPLPAAAIHPPRPSSLSAEPPYHPSPEQIAACEANPEAMAALEAGDAWRFARAMGIEHPSPEYLAAAEGLPADIEHRLPMAQPSQRPPNRHERRHPG